MRNKTGETSQTPADPGKDALFAKIYLVTLLEFEKVVPRGVSRQTWSVYCEGRWLSARLVPGAVVSAHSSRPGYIWERSVELKLAPGTKLELLSERPRPRKSLDAFSILTVDQASPTLVRKVPHQVSSCGQLSRVNR